MATATAEGQEAEPGPAEAAVVPAVEMATPAEEAAAATPLEAAAPEAAEEPVPAAESPVPTPEQQEQAAPATEPAAPPKPEEELEVGMRVMVVGLPDKPQLTGVTGTLVEKKWRGNWVVDLDDSEGRKRRLRRRWLIHCDHLELTTKPAMQKYAASNGRPKLQYFIVGTWNDFVPRRMVWDAERICWTFEAKVGANGFECFQIWLERDKRKSVHPDTANAGHYVPWELCGPDDEGEGKNWTFGDGNSGVRYEVRLFLWEDEAPQAVEWCTLDSIEAGNRQAKGETQAQAVALPAACRCPTGHVLAPFESPVEGYSCSTCQKKFLKGTRLYSCRPCDYDVCAACWQGPKEKSNSTVAQEAAQFLRDCSQPSRPTSANAGTAAGQTASTPNGPATASRGSTANAAVDVAPPAAPKEALSVGDRVSVRSNGPYRGRTGVVIKVDEDGDPAVRLDGGEAKLFYRCDVSKMAPPAEGQGKGSQKGAHRTLGVLGFRGGDGPNGGAY